ncbi:MAG: PucR family transcriptional regulator [Pseudomonadota bacterium]
MPTAITRFFDDPAELQSVRDELVYRKRLPRDIVRAYTSPDNLVHGLTSRGVEPRTAEAYRDRMSQGGAVLLVLADYTPLGVARITREVLSKSGAADLGDLPEEAAIAFVPNQKPLNVLPGAPLMLTRPRDPSSTTYHMADWPIPLITEKLPSPDPAIPRHARMASWPIGLLLPGNIRYGRFPFDLLIPGKKYMANFPFGHLVPSHVRYGRFPIGLLAPSNVRYGRFPIGLLIPGNKFMARFPFGHIVPKGWRHMANWPFPLLMNGKRGTNSLVPGNKFMANFPFGHLVSSKVRYGRFPIGLLAPSRVRYGRFPIGLLVPGNKFMAKFPFGHIVPGHKHMAKFPFDHIVPGHKYMANWILPHTNEKGRSTMA